MSGYTTSDLSESLEIARYREGSNITRESIEKVHYAWGYSPEGGGSWTGGFIMELKDGTFAELTGWCDYTGWGCQDGVKVKYYDTLPKPPEGFKNASYSEPPDQLIAADHLPADLNRWVQGEFDTD